MDYIVKALESPEMLIVPEFISYVGYPIDTFLIDKFWASLEENMLVYVDDELIQWLGYSNSDHRLRKQNFMQLLKTKDYYHYDNAEYEKFLLDNSVYLIGYTEIYPPIDRSNGKGKTKHLLIPSKTLKLVMMQVSTSRGDQVREYYWALEDLFKTYVKYQSEYEKRKIANESENIKKELDSSRIREEKANQQIVIAQNQLAAKTTYINNIKSLIENTRPLSFKEYVYIATTDFYSTRNQFKLGKATNLKSRLSAYNIGRPEGDRYYYTYIWPTADSALLEKKITTHLRQWQDAKDREMYVINYDWLYLFTRQVCEHDRVEIEMINELVANYEAIVGREPPKVAAVNALNGVEITKLPSGLDPLPLPTPTPAPENNTNQAEQVQFLISSLHLTRTETIEILTSLLRPLLPGPAKSKDVNGVIRTRIGRGFRVAEWKAAVKEVASRIGLSIRYR
jgi:hypothetical protein